MNYGKLKFRLKPHGYRNFLKSYGDPPLNESNYPKKKKLGDVPSIVDTNRNLDKSTSFNLKDLNFKVDEDFKYLYKEYATSKRISMVDLLKASFELYRKSNP